MAKRGADASRAPSAKSQRDTLPGMDADAPAPQAEPPTSASAFVTPAVSVEPAAREPSGAAKRRVEVKSPQLDSPSRRKGPGRSSPPALGGAQPEPAEPGPRRARGGAGPLSPPPGCSTDALRIHFELVIKGFEQNIAQQAQQQADSQARIVKLEADVKHVHDELTADAKENHDKVKNEVFSLRTELSSFAASLQEVNTENAKAIGKIESIDRAFKEHLDVAFVCIEVKCASLSTVIDELNDRIPPKAPPAPMRMPPGVPAGVTVHELSPEPKPLDLAERLAAVELQYKNLETHVQASFTEGCHCIHVKWLLEEFPKMQKVIWELKARGASPVAPGGPPAARMGPSSISGDCPHCSHVDLLMSAWPETNARLAALE